MKKTSKKSVQSNSALNINSHNKIKNFLNNNSNNNSINSRNNSMLNSSIFENSKIENLMHNSEALSQHSKLDKLKDINLFEKNKNYTIYEWKNLFNHCIPLKKYTKPDLNDDNKISNKNFDKFNKSFDNVKSPTVLIDLPEDKINNLFPNFFHKNKNNNNNNNFIIRPKSVYSKREPGETFYFSQQFSDYYKENFFEFIKKFPLLQAKKKISTNKLKKEILNVNKSNLNIKKILENLKNKMNKSKNNLIIDNKLFFLAKFGGNINPLMNSILKQTYPKKYEKLKIKNNYHNRKKNSVDNFKKFNKNENKIHILKKINMDIIDEENNDEIYINNINNEINNFYLNYNTYDENDPDLYILKRVEELCKINNEEEIINKYYSKDNLINIENNNNDTYLSNNNNNNNNNFQNLKVNEYNINNNIINNKNKQKFIQKIFSPINQNDIIKKRPKTAKNQIKINKNNNNNNNYKFDNKISKSKSSKAILIHKSTQKNEFTLGIKDTNSNSISSSIQQTNEDIIDYIPTKSLPIKFNSKIQNLIYQKIDKNIKLKHNLKTKEKMKNFYNKLLIHNNNNFNYNNVKFNNKSLNYLIYDSDNIKNKYKNIFNNTNNNINKNNRIINNFLNNNNNNLNNQMNNIKFLNINDYIDVYYNSNNNSFRHYNINNQEKNYLSNNYFNKNKKYLLHKNFSNNNILNTSRSSSQNKMYIRGKSASHKVTNNNINNNNNNLSNYSTLDLIKSNSTNRIFSAK